MRNGTHKAYFLLLILTVIWLGMIVAAPLLTSAGSVAGPALYLFFHPICHQLPERSYFWYGHQLAVCHRCLGIYTGFLVGLLVFGLSGRLLAAVERHPRIIGLCLLPLVIDVFLANTSASRFLTGVVASFPVAAIVLMATYEVSSWLRAQPNK